jgi:NAD(P)-dependent dehydrogenase (short-subunit alcohol dehydrogenase family)
MQMDFTDQVAVVTGAGRNLGRAYALEFAKAGAAVVVNDAGLVVAGGEKDDAKVADSVVKEITDAGGRAVASYDLVDTPEGGENIVTIALDNFGRIDAIVANAGNRRADWFGEIDPEDFTAILNTHLNGILYVSQAAWKPMKERGYGRFLLTSSSAGLFGFPGTGAYATAKAGVVGLVNTMALEGKRDGIFVNGLLPTAPTGRGKEAHGAMHSEATAMVASDGGQEHSDWMVPEEVAPFVVASCSSDWRATQRLYSVTGGRIAEVFAGITKGWYAPDYHNYTPEEVIAAQDEISDRTEYAVPRILTEEYAVVDRWRP